MDSQDKVYKDAFRMDRNSLDTFNYQKQRRSVLEKIENRSIHSALNLKRAVWGLSVGLASCFLALFLFIQAPTVSNESGTLLFNENVELFAEIEFYEHMEIFEALSDEDAGSGAES